MSADSCLIRVTPHELKGLSEYPDAFSSFISDLRKHSNFYNPKLDDLVGRVLYVDEFTRSLLMDMTSLEPTFAPLNRALMLGGHVLNGGGYGHVPFHNPDEVAAISEELNGFPEECLRARFDRHAAAFRVSSAGLLENDKAILRYQRGHFDRLVAFYRVAARSGDAMLLLVL